MIKKIMNIITTIIMIILLFIAGVLYLPKAFGITPMVVLSGSMEPTYHVGSLVFVEETNPANLNIGDNVTFYLNNTKTVVTHRIIEKNVDANYYITKGDNNNTSDKAQLVYANILGKAMNFSIPFIGYLAVYLNTTAGIVTLLFIAAVVLIISFAFDRKTKKKGVA